MVETKKTRDENRKLASFSASERAEIARRRAAGEVAKVIAADFGTCDSTICKIAIAEGGERKSRRGPFKAGADVAPVVGASATPAASTPAAAVLEIVEFEGEARIAEAALARMFECPVDLGPIVREFIENQFSGLCEMGALPYRAAHVVGRPRVEYLLNQPQADYTITRLNVPDDAESEHAVGAKLDRAFAAWHRAHPPAAPTPQPQGEAPELAHFRAVLAKEGKMRDGVWCIDSWSLGEAFGIDATVFSRDAKEDFPTLKVEKVPSAGGRPREVIFLDGNQVRQAVMSGRNKVSTMLRPLYAEIVGMFDRGELAPVDYAAAVKAQDLREAGVASVGEAVDAKLEAVNTKLELVLEGQRRQDKTIEEIKRKTNRQRSDFGSEVERHGLEVAFILSRSIPGESGTNTVFCWLSWKYSRNRVEIARRNNNGSFEVLAEYARGHLNNCSASNSLFNFLPCCKEINDIQRDETSQAFFYAVAEVAGDFQRILNRKPVTQSAGSNVIQMKMAF